MKKGQFKYYKDNKEITAYIMLNDMAVFYAKPVDNWTSIADYDKANTKMNKYKREAKNSRHHHSNICFVGMGSYKIEYIKGE